MKRNLLLLLGIGIGILATSQAYAQQQTLFSNQGITSVGGYGGPLLQFSTLNGRSATYSGGFGGMILNKSITITGGGMSLTSEAPVAEAISLNVDEALDYSVELGGLYLGYSFFSDRVIHPEFTLLAGGGRVSQRNQFGDEYGASDVAMIIPGAEITMNVTSFFRLSLGANYRWVTGSDTPGLSDAQLSRPGGYASFKFGFFGWD
ncbi:MAG TPA: hypothetical protein DCE41_10595 [Cytophagales bacterium]|nr:hypothetical protein [Cytophagales bacterium]